MLLEVTATQLFPSPVTIHFKAAESICRRCDEPLRVLKSRPRKRAATLAIGGFIAHETMNGGYILHLDGTCDGATPHLISVLDGITEIVLDNEKLSSENAEQLIPLLQGVKRAYGVPLAVVSDMGKGIALAVQTVFPHARHFICHYHFLKAVGKNLLAD